MLKKIAAAAVVTLIAILGTVALFPSQAQIVTSYLLRTNNGSDILNTTTFRANLGAAKNGAVTGSGITMTTARLLGRTTASTGAIEEISVGTGLTLSGGSLTASGGTGTVTSVALALPSSILTVSGSPVTTTGTLTGALATQNANLVWAGPTTGSAAAPTFRSLVVADLPSSGNYSTSGFICSTSTNGWCIGSNSGNYRIDKAGAAGYEFRMLTSANTLAGLTISGITVAGLGSDSGKVDNTVCADSGGILYKGSGTLGICLGTSSARYKRDFGNLPTTVVSKIIGLRPLSYRYRTGYGDGGARRDYWLLAEQVVKILPACVPLDKNGKPSSVDPVCIQAFMIKAFQEDHARLVEMRKTVDMLRAREAIKRVRQ